MDLNRVYVTQRRLRNVAQLPALIEAVADGAPFPPVLLAELEDGTVFIQDGHHRCLAFVLEGRTKLQWGDFILLPMENTCRPTHGKLMDPTVIRRLLGR